MEDNIEGDWINELGVVASNEGTALIGILKRLAHHSNRHPQKNGGCKGIKWDKVISTKVLPSWMNGLEGISDDLDLEMYAI